MTPDVTHLSSLPATRAVRSSRPLQTSRPPTPVDSLQLSSEARQKDQTPTLSPGYLAALGQSLKPAPQLPQGSYARIRANVEQALRLRQLSESERTGWLQSQLAPGGSMDYQPQVASENDLTRRLKARNCGAVGAALALRQEAILKLAGGQDREQVLDGIRESQRYLNGEPSQLGQRGRQQHGGDALAQARRLQSRDFQDVPNNAEGNLYLEQLRRQLVNSYVGKPELSPEAAMLSQQLAVARARRAGSLPC